MVRLHIYCTLGVEAFQKWQLQTYEAIMNAYRSKVVDYEEKLAAAQAEGGVRISGNNPLINRQIERDELKKSCITLWTGFKYNGVPGIAHNEAEAAKPPNNYPEIHIDNSLDLTPEIQFLEQSFDWTNMTYQFLPYYWSPKKMGRRPGAGRRRSLVQRFPSLRRRPDTRARPSRGDGGRALLPIDRCVMVRRRCSIL